MKNIKTKLIAVMLVVAVVMTGCMKQEEIFKISKDGSATVVSTVQISDEALRKVMADTNGHEPTAVEYAEMALSLKQQGFEKVDIEGKTYHKMTETQKMGNKELNASLNEKTTGYATGDTFYAYGKAEQEYGGMEAKDLGISLDDEMLKEMEEIIILEFEEPIVNTNGVIDPENPNKVTFNIDLSKKSYTVFATTKPGVTKETVKATIKKLNTVNKSSVKKIKADKTKKKSKKASLTVSLKKVKGTKYQVQYPKKKNMKGGKKVTFKKTTGKIKNLKKGTKYYVRVRAFKTNYAGKTVYSDWSKVKAKKTKK
ncbi:MAG: fibronectin type III domain-containing protein [Lachnospiraceae bacterium]|nr:fibronectin type III domain-containing protein [Lachnospiraceae bacterium]